MKTDFKNINMFETAIVSWAFVGIVMVGIVFFTSLSPQKQVQVSEALNIFDIQQSVTSAVDDLSFALFTVPNNFYNQVYIAFNEVVTDTPTTIALIANSLSDQAVRGYSQQIAENYYPEKISGALIDLTSDPLAPIQALEIPYSYTSPDLPKIDLYTLRSKLK